MSKFIKIPKDIKVGDRLKFTLHFKGKTTTEIMTLPEYWEAERVRKQRDSQTNNQASKRASKDTQ